MTFSMTLKTVGFKGVLLRAFKGGLEWDLLNS